MNFFFVAICVSIANDSNPNGISGDITFSQKDENSKLKISGSLSGLSPGSHGLHIHQFPELGNNCSDAGPHFNPTNVLSLYYLYF